MLTEEKREQGTGQREGEGQETTYTRTVAAPLSEVYRAFTHPVALRDWLCDVAKVEPRTGGRVYLAWDNDYYTAGRYTELARNERVAFTWRGPSDPADSQVLVTLAQAAEG
ncbi:MAG TPA: SRPBCC domain-containing protein, partial [Chloroflexia bacterium]|nr:SRPBCC domain-containing protein [Chloroflexia bacterium]